MTCISLVEVFPVAAGAFFFGKNDVPEIFMTCISPVEVSPAAAGAFFSAQMAFLEFSAMYQPC